MTYYEYTQRSKEKGWKFNIVVNHPIENLEYIHPIKQELSLMCIMVKRSKVSMKKAKDALETYEICNGEEWLDSACFDTQQAIEFLMKGLLLNYNIPFSKEHDISYLLERLNNAGFYFDKQEDLEARAATLIEWEEKGRYGKGIKTSVNTVRRFHNIYESMLTAFLAEQEKNQVKTSASFITES